MALGSYDTGLPNVKNPMSQAWTDALTRAQTKKAEQESGIGGLTGSLGNAARLYGLEQEHGSEHPLINSLKQMQQLEQDREKGILEWQQAQLKSLPTRLLTSEGKTLNELQDLKEGYKLGTRNTKNPEKLSDPERNFQIAQYEMAQLNKNTDSGQRDRLRASADVHTTLGSINPKEAFKYSGTWGGLAKKAEQSLSSLTGKESEDYALYEENMTSMKLLAKQLSRFFGAGASEGIQKDIEDIANPNSWLKSPKVAERKFNRLMKIFELESENLRTATQNPGFYGFQSPGGQQQERGLDQWSEQELMEALQNAQ
jgi:hypothetical protein